MNNIYLGIDNGHFGCTTVLENKKEPVFYDTPIYKIKVAKKIRDEFDVLKMVEILWPYTGLVNFSTIIPVHSIICAFIEETIAMPRQSSQSSATTGYGKGLWYGILAALKIKHEEVLIKDWQSHFGIYGKGKNTKEEAFMVASGIFPRSRLTRKTNRGTLKILDGRCDSLLIAEYSRRLKGEKQ